MAKKLRVGAKVLVAWGLSRDVEGTVVEVWGDPPEHVRVRLHFNDDDEKEFGPTTILLSPSIVTAA